MSGESKQDEQKEFTRKCMQMVQKRNEEPTKDTLIEREMTREEKEEKGRKCMEIMREKNEKLKRRYAEVQQDRKSAEEAQSSVTLQFRASASSTKVDKEEEIVKPQVLTREWDMHKTCDSAWEPPENWKSFEHRSNFPDRRYDRTKDYADKRGTYARQDRRYQNSFNSAETKPKFVRNSDEAPRRSDNFAFRQTNNNHNYVPRGRGRGLKPRMYEKVSPGEDNARSSSFNRTPQVSSQRSNTHQNTASTNFDKKPYSGWSSSPVEIDNKTPSSFHKKPLNSTFNDKRQFEAGVCNKSQMFKNRLTPPSNSCTSYVSENKITGGNWSDGSDNDSKVTPGFDKNSSSILKDKGELDTWTESSPTENPFSTDTNKKSSWLGSSSDDYKSRTDIYTKSALTSKKNFNEIRSNNRSQMFEKRSLSVTVCDANRRRVVQGSGCKSLNAKNEATKITSRIEHKTDEWGELHTKQFEWGELDTKKFEFKEDNSKISDSGTWSDTELPEKSQQVDGWSDVEVTTEKLEICDSNWVDSSVNVSVSINKKCAENVINKQMFSSTKLTENPQQLDEWSDAEVTSDKPKICDFNWIDSSVDALKGVDEKRAVNVINKKFSETGSNVENTASDGLEQKDYTGSDEQNHKSYSATEFHTKETLNDVSNIVDKKNVYEPNKSSRGSDSLNEANNINEILIENVSDVLIESSNSCSNSSNSASQLDVENVSVNISKHDETLNPKYDETGLDGKNVSEYNTEEAEVKCLNIENVKCSTTICNRKDECDISQNNDEIVFDSKSISDEHDDVINVSASLVENKCIDTLIEDNYTSEQLMKGNNFCSNPTTYIQPTDKNTFVHISKHANDETRLDVDSISINIPKHKDANVESYQKCDSSKSDIKNTPHISQNNDIVYDNQDIAPEPKTNSKCSDSLDESKSINETLIENENISDVIIENRVFDSDPQIPTEQLDKMGDIINCLDHKLYVCDSSSDCLPVTSVVDSKRTVNVTGADCDSKCDDANDDSWDTYSEGTGSDD